MCFYFLKIFRHNSQLCGDVNDDATINILDIINIIDYVSLETPQPIIEANADLDGHAGITISDAKALSVYMFQGGGVDCTISTTYSFAPAPYDTLFIPRVLSIPEDLDTEMNLP